jgi:hypothetical protein
VVKRLWAERTHVPYVLLSENDSSLEILANALDAARDLLVAPHGPPGGPGDREFLHGEERQVFWALTEASRGNDLHVVGQVSLAAMFDLSRDSILVEQVRSQAGHDRSVESIRRGLTRHPVDFVLCSGPPYALPLVMIEYDGQQKDRDAPDLQALKRAQQNALAGLGGITLCRIKRDASKGWTWSLADLQEFLAVVVCETRRFMRTDAYLDLLLARLESVATELSVGSETRRALGDDLRFLLGHQVDRLSQLERANGELRARVEELQGELSLRPDPYEDSEQHHFDEFCWITDAADHARDLLARKKAAPPAWLLGLRAKYAIVDDERGRRVEAWLERSSDAAAEVCELPEPRRSKLKVDAYGALAAPILESYAHSVAARLITDMVQTLRPHFDELLRAVEAHASSTFGRKRIQALVSSISGLATHMQGDDARMLSVAETRVRSFVCDGRDERRKDNAALIIAGLRDASLPSSWQAALRRCAFEAGGMSHELEFVRASRLDR